jgi:hypothetical protein
MSESVCDVQMMIFFYLFLQKQHYRYIPGHLGTHVANAHTRATQRSQRDRTTRNASLSLPPQPVPFPSVVARSRRGRPGTRASRCARPSTAAAYSGTCTAAKQTTDQMRVLEILSQLDVATDWRGVTVRSARPGRWQLPCGLRC